jgi:type VI secretion system secreted protein Hcp
MASVDYFLKIDGIPGESTDAKHKGEIVLDSFSWGETNAGASATGGAGAGKVSMQDFHFTAKFSKASPNLMLACASGKHIPSATMSVRKGGGADFLHFKLSDVLVSSFQTAGARENLPEDAVSLAFAKIEVDYKEQKVIGSLGVPIAFGWDLRANKSA